MIQRYWRFLLAALVILVVALGFWLWNRPAAQPTLERMTLDDGSALIRATPSTKVKTRVALAVTTEDSLTEKQVLALSYDASAQVIQVVLPKDDCQLQQKAFNAALQKLDGTPDVVAGISAGGSVAWDWLAGQGNDKAQAISVNFVLNQPDCKVPAPKSAAHGKWTVAWNDGPDDETAVFVRDTPNAETKISDYDIKYPQILNTEVRHLLIADDANGGLNIPVVEVPSSQPSDTVTLFLSGDGGWRDLDKDVAGDMAKSGGYPVVGIDTLRYYWEHKSPEQTASDLSELMAHYRQKWGAKHFVLAGYSFGADVLPAVYNRLPEEDKARVDGIILLAFARSGSFEIAVEGWLGASGKEAATGPEMAKLPADKVFCVYGVEEKDESGCTEATAPGQKLQLPGGHHFDENYPSLAKRLIAVIDKWKGKEAPESASAE
ncbi:virulence factor family protein [Pseudomonas sp. GD03842]|uniref:AcvB/VirJ family lysyl-phosphatidylglycerol hydrolase n=1 Tax=unclassified Pseudomonas TaxID=196821 RepID=UPI000D33394B|nr:MULTISPECIES: AcvB/VirJ family lysyl-phosphatidylglycerol hydrolase [unclassified Pseudomonas]MDH0747596.1 virulence factor family protein [Pseudomonas sp. GD03842]RAU49371.1 virulence factor family protein [Pseudomonas sp. RIT 409]RAU55889.1 virulence factor family protein [Pseudomonas sp. RIT 412]